jgi:hypothetical protein
MAEVKGKYFKVDLVEFREAQIEGKIQRFSKGR